MKLSLYPHRLAICRLDADAPDPDWIPPGTLCSVTRTPHELSVVCEEGAHIPVGVQRESPWQALVVEGPLDFGLIGILAELSGSLAAAGVSIFALSTFDTDYLLVKNEQQSLALKALTDAGHEILT